jgi:hypothetical protein
MAAPQLPLGWTTAPICLPDRSPNDAGPIIFSLTAFDALLAGDALTVAGAFALPVGRHPVPGDLDVFAPVISPDATKMQVWMQGGIPATPYVVTVFAATPLGREASFSVSVYVTN